MTTIILETKDFLSKKDFHNKRREYVAKGYTIKEHTLKKIILYKQHEQSKIPVFKKNIESPSKILLNNNEIKAVPKKRSITPSKKGPIVKKEENHASVLKRSATPPHMKFKK
jgi:hypothetical protein